MSILFYRRPDYTEKPSGPMNSLDCAQYVEKAKKSQHRIPAGLGFDDILNDKTLPPCSLTDFLSYLLHVEHSAENLQFYLWYKRYAERFNCLPEQQKRLSPIWTHKQEDLPELLGKTEAEKRLSYANAKRQLFVTMLKHDYDPRESILFGDDSLTHERPISQVRNDVKNGGASITPFENSTLTAAALSGVKWQPFTTQPLRDEVNRMVHRYLAFKSPRELNLSHRTRAAVLHALQHTTHPSALRPALMIAESSLRGQSHPNFIRWSICNGSKPRIFFVRGASACTVMMGLVMGIVMICSGLSRWWRLLAGLLWWVGATGLIAAAKGLCVVLYHSHSRMLKPWEDNAEDIDVELDNRSTDATEMRLPPLPFEVVMEKPVSLRDKSLPYLEEYGGVKNDVMHNLEIGEPLGNYRWQEKERKRNIWSKVFQRGVWIQEEKLRVLQDRIIFGAMIWATIGTAFSLVVVLSIPELGIL